MLFITGNKDPGSRTIINIAELICHVPGIIASEVGYIHSDTGTRLGVEFDRSPPSFQKLVGTLEGRLMYSLPESLGYRLWLGRRGQCFQSRLSVAAGNLPYAAFRRKIIVWDVLLESLKDVASADGRTTPRPWAVRCLTLCIGLRQIIFSQGGKKPLCERVAAMSTDRVVVGHDQGVARMLLQNRQSHGEEGLQHKPSNKQSDLKGKGSDT